MWIRAKNITLAKLHTWLTASQSKLSRRRMASKIAHRKRSSWKAVCHKFKILLGGTWCKIQLSSLDQAAAQGEGRRLVLTEGAIFHQTLFTIICPGKLLKNPHSQSTLLTRNSTLIKIASRSKRSSLKLQWEYQRITWLWGSILEELRPSTGLWMRGTKNN